METTQAPPHDLQSLGLYMGYGYWLCPGCVDAFRRKAPQEAIQYGSYADMVEMAASWKNELDFEDYVIQCEECRRDIWPIVSGRQWLLMQAVDGERLRVATAAVAREHEVHGHPLCP